MTTFWLFLVYFIASLVFAVLFGRFCLAGRGTMVDSGGERKDVNELAELEIEKLRRDRYRRAS
jgi:hypothetical protein